MVIDSFMRDMRSPEEIRNRVNERYDRLFRFEDNKPNPHVCGICDEFIAHEDDIKVLTEKKIESIRDLLSWDKLPTEERITAIEKHYQFKGRTDGLQRKDLFKNLAVSPKSCLYRKTVRSKPGLLVCKDCNCSLGYKKVPFYSIINKNYIGCAPACLTDLNDS